MQLKIVTLDCRTLIAKLSFNFNLFPAIFRSLCAGSSARGPRNERCVGRTEWLTPHGETGHLIIGGDRIIIGDFLGVNYRRLCVLGSGWNFDTEGLVIQRQVHHHHIVFTLHCIGCFVCDTISFSILQTFLQTLHKQQNNMVKNRYILINITY